MKKKHVKFLKQIVETPSPTGSEVAVADIVRERLSPIADEIRTDTMGSVHATYEGSLHVGADAADALRGLEPEEFAPPIYGVQPDQGIDEYHDPYFDDDDEDDDDAFEEDGQPAFDGLPVDAPLTLMLAAHMDEIGLMVTYVSDEGFLSIAAIGGVDAAILPGMRVDVHAQGGTLRGVVGRKPIHLIDADERKNVTPLDKLVIDLGMPAKDVKKKVRVGDSITIAAGFEQFGRGMAVSRAFDDKVGVFIACRVMEKLADDPDYGGNFVAAITVQEEIGTRGAMTSAHAIMPDVALAFDVTHATDYPGIDKTKHGNIVCGGGPVIARGPNINPVVFERLVKAAEDEGIPYQLEAEPSVTGTDARAIQVTREGVPTGLVSIPLRYMHTPTEVISLDDVSATVRLIARFASDLDEAADFVPGHPEDYESDLMLESGEFDEDYDFLMDEVVRLAEEVADLQALAGVGVHQVADWGTLEAYGEGYQDADEDAGYVFAEADEHAAPDDGFAPGEGGFEGYAVEGDGYVDEEALDDHADGEGVSVGHADGDEDFEDYAADDAMDGSHDDEVVSPEDAPFGRQQGAISAEFASIDIDAKPTSDASVSAGSFQVQMPAKAEFQGDADGAFGDSDEDGYDDEAPAAYADDSEGAPAVKLKFEDPYGAGDAEDAEDSDYDEPGEKRPSLHPASEGANVARSTLPIVMVDTSALEGDE